MPKIGDTIWIFDPNRRVYAKDGHGGPIWREHWRPETIRGETNRSWVTALGKRPKKGGAGVAFTQAEIDQAEFVELHAWRIAEKIRAEKDYATLAAVAKMVGYKPKEHGKN